ncbi:hypothetical protein [Fusobacterium sp.]|uniref:hypothetical protein n=1 Tax=Fusobacterium sp. TaxID=68766 RepID=UPI0029024727|nr:hypothetical protein [Fusobacterium sp.]MDU1912222.1 hypothetical protein [Fusobacterium sp.]
MLNGKNLNILELLFQNEYTVEDLSSVLNLNSRTIRYNIKDINGVLNKCNLNGILKNKDKYFLEKKEMAKIKKLISEFSSLTFIDRRDYLITKLLIDDKIILSHESRILDVARRTLNYDLVEIKKFLTSYSVTIEVIHGKGITLHGDEKHLKILLIAFLTKFISKGRKLKNIFKDLLYSIVTEEKIDEYMLKGNKLLKIAGKNIQIYSFYSIIAIFVASHLKRKEFEDSYIYSYSSQQYYEYFNVVREFIKGDIELSNFSIHIITFILMGTYSTDLNENLHRDIEEFLKELNERSNDELNINEEFVRKISSVIKISIYKSKFNIVQKNLDFTDVPKYCSKMFNKIYELVPKYFIKFPMEDFILLTIIIQENIEKEKYAESKPKKILVVDNTFEQRATETVIKKLQCTYNIEIAEVIPDYRIEYFLSENKDIDLIISLANLDDEPHGIPVLKIYLSDFWNSINILDEFNIPKKY